MQNAWYSNYMQWYLDMLREGCHLLNLVLGYTLHIYLLYQLDEITLDQQTNQLRLLLRTFALRQRFHLLEQFARFLQTGTHTSLYRSDDILQ